jgi:hypothetical protein
MGRVDGLCHPEAQNGGELMLTLELETSKKRTHGCQLAVTPTEGGHADGPIDAGPVGPARPAPSVDDLEGPDRPGTIRAEQARSLDAGDLAARPAKRLASRLDPIPADRALAGEEDVQGHLPRDSRLESGGSRLLCGRFVPLHNNYPIATIYLAK